MVRRDHVIAGSYGNDPHGYGFWAHPVGKDSVYHFVKSSVSAYYYKMPDPFTDGFYGNGNGMILVLGENIQNSGCVYEKIRNTGPHNGSFSPPAMGLSMIIQGVEDMIAGIELNIQK